MAAAGLLAAPLTATSAAAAGTPASRADSHGTRLAASSQPPSTGSLGTVSCASPGNCSAGGVYLGQSEFSYPSVADEQHGVWGHPAKVEGLPAPQYGDTPAGTLSVSCASPGNCGAGGFYAAGYNAAAFVVSEKHGRWGAAELITGLPDTSGGAEIESVSCGSPGNCGAGGYYYTTSTQQAFVITERHGTWGAAEPVTGLAQLNTGEQAAIESVSCASARNCSAGGYYSTKTSRQAFVVTQQHGTWGTAHQLASPVSGGGAQINAVSCARPGNCSAAGLYATSSGQQAFVISEKHGTWAAAEPVPGLAGLNKGGAAEISALSCPSPGNCGAGGYYQTSVNFSAAFVVDEKHGTWGAAEPVPGPAWLNSSGYAGVDSLSCAAPGNCTAIGSYGYWKDAQPFVVTEQHGSWGQALLVPGAPAAIAALDSVSCATPGNCSAVGAYTPDYWDPSYALAASQQHGVWGEAQILTNP
jgi:hypothetical protein